MAELISRKITEALGDRLTVQSEPGVRSVFLATIDTGLASGQSIVESAIPTVRPAQKCDIRLTGRRILIVDDGAKNRKAANLEAAALEGDHASCGVYLSRLEQIAARIAVPNTKSC